MSFVFVIIMTLLHLGNMQLIGPYWEISDDDFKPRFGGKPITFKPLLHLGFATKMHNIRLVKRIMLSLLLFFNLFALISLIPHTLSHTDAQDKDLKVPQEAKQCSIGQHRYLLRFPVIENHHLQV